MQERERVATELKWLVGWGAHPKRLALLPELRKLAGVIEDTPVVEAGYLVRRHLVSAIDSLSGWFEFDGRQIEADRMRRAVRVLLQIEGTGQSAMHRRYRVITLLGIYRSIEQWRRPFGSERDLLDILADHMTKPSGLQT